LNLKLIIEHKYTTKFIINKFFYVDRIKPLAEWQSRWSVQAGQYNT